MVANAQQADNLPNDTVVPPTPSQEPDLATQLGFGENPKPIDPDHARLDAAMAELEAEEAAKAGGGEETKTPDQQAADDAAAALPKGSIPQDPSAAIPKPRFDQVSAKARELHEKNIALAAQNELLTKLVMSGGVTPEQARAIQEGRAEMPNEAADPYAGVDAEEIALADAYDKAEITTQAEYKRRELAIQKKRRAIDNQIAEVREASRLQSTTAPATKTIEQHFTVLQHISQGQLDACVPLARINLQEELTSNGLGAFDKNNPRHVLMLQAHSAQVADLMYNEGKGVAAWKAANGQSPTTPAAPQAPAPALNPARDPRQVRKDKIGLAANMPPNLTQTRETQNNATPGSFDAQVETMTTEQIAAAMKADPGRLNEIMGIK